MTPRFHPILGLALAGLALAGCQTWPGQPPLTLTQKAGQMVMMGIDGTDAASPAVQQALAQIRAGQLGGVILFRNNITSPGQVRALNAAAARTSFIEVPTDKGHDAESIKGMIPDGAEPFKGKISQGITVTLDKEGVYGVRCSPHYAMGMVALIVVGQPTNLKEAEAVKNPGKAKAKFAELFAKVPAN